MPRGSRRTSYVRDTRGRFASTPGGGAPKRPPAKKASRGTNRLTRDNSGRITSVGGNGATARGGRLRTGAGNLRARQTDRLKRAPLQGVVSRGGKARAGAVKKPVGWMQSPEARGVRSSNAAERTSLARRIKSLPRVARRSVLSTRNSAEQEQSRQRAVGVANWQANAEVRASTRVLSASSRKSRITFARVYHGTSREAAGAIRSSGYRETLRGLYGPGVYMSTNKAVAKEYADWRAAGSPDPRKLKRKGNQPTGSILAHRVPMRRITKGTEKLDPSEQRKIVRGGGARTVDALFTGKPGSFAIMSADLANKTLIRQSGVVRPRKPRRRRRKP